MTADFGIVGAGPAGLLMALLLARRGAVVDVRERRADPRLTAPEAGRSINLALAARGLVALEAAGLRAQLDDLLVPMRGRQVHAAGSEALVPYGQRPEEQIYSISRAALTLRLTEAAGRVPQISLSFGQRCVGVDEALQPRLQGRDGREHRLAARCCIAADGAGSAVREALARDGRLSVRDDFLDHDYKELMLPAGRGTARLERHALHIWPRGGFMLIALPNADGSFTATLFLPRSGSPSFETLDSDGAVTAFFEREFPDVPALVPDLAAQFRAHPQGRLGTVHAAPWNQGERLLLIGDAAHAIVPFHGQGMNCAFEDCRLLDALVADGEPRPFERFARSRPRDTEAIATMALENYGEMRDAVLDPRFLLQKTLALTLERRHPRRFVPRYAMVMFRADIPYAVALERGAIQQHILDRLTDGATAVEDVDLAAADRLVLERLPPLSLAGPA